MADLSRYLPLSQGGGEDESTVSGDWRPLTADCLDLVTDLLGEATEEGWGRETAGGGSVGRRAALLLQRLETPRAALLAAGLISPFRMPGARGVPPLRTVLPLSTGPLLTSLRSQAAKRRLPSGRRGVGDLTAVVVEGADLAATLGHPLPLPARATGAAALALASSARAPLASVLRGRSLAATDAGWMIGRGAAISAPADELLLFLAGRTTSVPGADA